MTRLGLNARERCDMITYCLSLLEAYPLNAIYFVDVQRYAKPAKLNTVPFPDVVTRVFMAFRCLLHTIQLSAYLRFRSCTACGALPSTIMMPMLLKMFSYFWLVSFWQGHANL